MPEGQQEEEIFLIPVAVLKCPRFLEGTLSYSREHRETRGVPLRWRVTNSPRDQRPNEEADNSIIKLRIFKGTYMQGTSWAEGGLKSYIV